MTRVNNTRGRIAADVGDKQCLCTVAVLPLTDATRYRRLLIYEACISTTDLTPARAHTHVQAAIHTVVDGCLQQTHRDQVFSVKRKGEQGWKEVILLKLIGGGEGHSPGTQPHPTPLPNTAREVGREEHYPRV